MEESQLIPLMTPPAAVKYESASQNANEPHPLATVCMITEANCDRHPSLSGTFADALVAANQKAATCLSRAADYQSFCGGAGASTASFYNQGRLVKSATVGNACQVTLPTCPNHPSYVGTFEVRGGVTSLPQEAQDKCLSSAATYQSWCRGEAARSAYVVNAVVAKMQASGKSDLLSADSDAAKFRGTAPGEAILKPTTRPMAASVPALSKAPPAAKTP